jgi:hypothetical protein
VRVLHRLAHAVRKLAQIDHHLLLGDRGDGGKRDDVVAGVLDVDDDFGSPAWQDLANSPELLGHSVGEDLKTDLDEGKFPIHPLNLSTALPGGKARSPRGRPAVDRRRLDA